jgi:hypothetical protein
MPRATILMPTHNRADIVGLAVQSVLDQTEGDFELLVVADGCTDDTVARIAGIDDPRIRIFDLPKAPYYGYANRNVALREARGEIVAFAAHDDLLFPDHLAQLTAAIEASGCDWIYSRPLWVSTDGVIVPYATNLTHADELEWFVTEGNTIPASCVAYRRSCLERFGYWPEDVPSAADWRHWIRIIEGGGRRNLAYLPTPTCLHFSANWRKSRHAGAVEMRAWLEVADASAWWPSALAYDIPDGTAEQQVIAEAMRAGGPAWVDAVRVAAARAVDRLAWEDLREIRPRLRALEREREQWVAHQGATGEALAAAAAQAAALESERDALRDRVAQIESERAARDGLQERFDRLAADREAIHAVSVALHDRAAHLASALDAARSDLTASRQHLAAVLASRSWRLLAPWRALKHAVLGR